MTERPLDQRGSPRVAVDAGPLLEEPTGVGRYVRELLGGLDALGVDVVRYAVSLRGRSDDSVARWRAPARVVQGAWRKTGRPAIERLTGPVDVVHATNFVLPPLAHTPGVVTVHDLSFLRSDTFPGGERLRDLVPWSVRRAARVIVPTHAIAREVVAQLDVGPERVAVTSEGVAPVFFGAAPLGDQALAELGIARPFAIAVATLEPRKNLALLLQAWEAAAETLRTWTLVLAGPRGWGPQLPETPGVVPLGFLGDETLPGLLAAADLFCYPSLYEGFGLPPLEAMAAGTPALVGRYGAAEEVLGDAAFLVDPTDPEAWAEALVRLGRDQTLRTSLARAGRLQAGRFTWQRTAAATLAVYRAALEGPHGRV